MSEVMLGIVSSRIAMSMLAAYGALVAGGVTSAIVLRRPSHGDSHIRILMNVWLSVAAVFGFHLATVFSRAYAAVHDEQVPLVILLIIELPVAAVTVFGPLAVLASITLRRGSREARIRLLEWVLLLGLSLGPPTIPSGSNQIFGAKGIVIALAILMVALIVVALIRAVRSSRYRYLIWLLLITVAYGSWAVSEQLARGINTGIVVSTVVMPCIWIFWSEGPEKASP